MPTVNCLLVGIDAYADSPLSGCLNDIAAAEEWIRSLPGTDANIRVLADAQARRDAVVEAITTHLGASGPGDTALLWFSGHGSEDETQDAREATGRAQALVCHDGEADGAEALADDLLGALLDGVAARGAHVVAVLDCCYAGGATREERPGATGRPRSTAWRPSWGRRPGRGAGPLPGRADPPRHVLLAASRLDEPAYETRAEPVRGAFSQALLGVLDELGPDASCRELLDLAAARMGGGGRQHPTLHGRGDRAFLHGGPVPVARFRLGFTRGAWAVNCGAVHGLRAPGSEFTARLSSGGTGTLVVREVLPESSRVEPVDGLAARLDPLRLTPVVPSALAFPPAAVTVLGDRAWTGPLADAVDGHPLLSTTGDGTPLAVEVRDGLAHVRGGARAMPPLAVRDAGDLAEVVDALAHLAHWYRVRDLANPDPSLSGLVGITLESLRGARRHSVTGEVVHEYTPEGREPQVAVTLHNRADRRLWCVLLDLTDDHGSSHALYEGDFIGPGRTARARRGEPVWLYLPEDRPVRPGAYVRDWLKLVVAEHEFDPAPLLLPPWRSGIGRRGPGGAPSPLLRLAAPEGLRKAGGPPRQPGAWGTAMLPLRTQVPGPGRI
ncbi:caspase family protein [Streptomyces sp. NPDC090029]|uniref:caspase family protein n=1 Tax=Streptomyces sp. NPDC090029 TaxID=3365924 RepID=UPI0038096A8A